MSDREFENYLTIISRLLRLSRGQEQAIGEELRDHFESRVAELIARGVGRDDAVRSALEEFGDAAGLAAQFSKITQTRRRRLIMRCTVASVTAIAAAVVVAMAVWPENQANHVVSRAAAQTATTKPSDTKAKEAQPKEARSTETQWERQLFRIQHVQCSNLANTIAMAFAGPNGAIVTAIPDSNSILISAPPDTLNEIPKLLSELDRQAPSIGIEVWFVNLQPDTRKGGESQVPSMPAEFLPAGQRAAVLEKLHQLEKDGRVVVANHFQLTCLDNQQAFAQQGERRAGTTTTNTTSTGRTSSTSNANIGTIVHVQARVSSGNEIVAAIDAEKSTPALEARGASGGRGSVGEATPRYAGGDQPTPTNIAILGQSTIRIASGDIVSLTGVEGMADEAAGSYQILVSAEVLPHGGAAAK